MITVFIVVDNSCSIDCIIVIIHFIYSKGLTMLNNKMFKCAMVSFFLLLSATANAENVNYVNSNLVQIKGDVVMHEPTLPPKKGYGQ